MRTILADYLKALLCFAAIAAVTAATVSIVLAILRIDVVIRLLH